MEMAQSSKRFYSRSLVTIPLMIFFVSHLCKSCPVQCQCDTTSKSVYCNDNSMVGIPRTIPSDTVSLTLTGTPSSRLDKVTHLQKSDLERMTELTELYIYFSGLSSIDGDTFQGLTLLRRAIFPGNKLTRIPEGLFQNLPNIDTIDLTGNRNCILEPKAFAGLSSLRFLYMGHMDLGSLEVNTFQDLTSLRGLYVEGNGIKNLDKDTLAPLTSLTTLDISENQLKMLPEDLLPSLSKLNNLVLSNNPWHCNCEIEWMKHLPTVSQAFFGSESFVFCEGPDNLKFQNLNSIPPEDLICIPPKVVDCGGPFSVDFGMSLSLTCTIEGDPTPKLSFTNPAGNTVEDTKIVSGYRIYQNYTFVIEKAAELDHGQWTADASNREGKDVKVFLINVLNIPTTTTTSLTPTSIERRHDRLALDDGGSNESMLGIILGSVFGGLSLIALLIIVGSVLYRKYYKNKVRPFKRERTDILDGFSSGSDRPLPPVSTAWI